MRSPLQGLILSCSVVGRNVFFYGTAISPNLNLVFLELRRELLLQFGINVLYVLLPKGKICRIIVAENAHSLFNNAYRVCPGIPDQQHLPLLFGFQQSRRNILNFLILTLCPSDRWTTQQKEYKISKEVLFFHIIKLYCLQRLTFPALQQSGRWLD